MWNGFGRIGCPRLVHALQKWHESMRSRCGAMSAGPSTSSGRPSGSLQQGRLGAAAWRRHAQGGAQL
eukprot:10757623-Alexandrium_andersonii.AAC.1